MHRNSELLFRKYGVELFKNNMRVLEIGPTGSPSVYEKVIDNSTIQWETLDIDKSSKTTYTASSEYSFPVPDNTFDIVLSGQVIEHVREIWVWIKELSRVCKPGGFVITISPVNWPYHEAPHDCWRIYPDGLKALYREGGLEVILYKRESLDEPPSGAHYYFRFFKKILKNPILSFKRFAHGLRDWQYWMAEDVIMIGKKL